MNTTLLTSFQQEHKLHWFREHVADNFNDGAAIFLDNVYVGAPTAFAAVTPSTVSSGIVERDLNSRSVDPNAEAAPFSGTYVADTTATCSTCCTASL